jgi:ribonuclease T1
MLSVRSQGAAGKLGVTFFWLATVLWCPGLVQAKAPHPDQSFQTVAVPELPQQARETYERIGRGGPFPYDKDGVVFGNRERQLPVQKRGFYREYTVKTPGSHDRGARRIVCGGMLAKAPEACYYTDDHYARFRKIVP